ncbi:probable serine hydrolase [Chelonus insularis]|uniref:probable serine hydrolase n=1 Tax=Chelonus insularis TaxID=460826 RepID=UPI00158A36D9|nr:probable serine hydrolase [Chelonus insularis]XP_034935954.1 probable serine hydrolase [Chelonus insularis]
MFLNKIFKSQLLQLNILRKYLSTTKATSKEYKEVEIKVPWGKLTGKYWGSSNVEPILALHGWQDNACSFDPLAQNLPDNVSLLAMDFPGHGFSSWIPDGIMYNTLLYVQAVHRVKEYYGMNKFGLMGHSLGGMVSFMYTSLFPNNIKFVIAFDYFKYPSLNAAKHLPLFAKDWNNFFKYEKLSTPTPSYTEEEAINRWIKATRNSIDESLCKILMQRGATKKPDGSIFFHRDPRVKLFLTDTGFSHDHLKVLAMQIYCPCMIIKGENSRHNEPKEFSDDVLKVIEKHSSDFRFHTVPGTHHFHMSNAKQVAEIISPFAHQYIN